MNVLRNLSLLILNHVYMHMPQAILYILKDEEIQKT